MGLQDKGVLYGMFHLLRLLAQNADLKGIELTHTPYNVIRMLNLNIDNTNTHFEGVCDAPKFIKKWDELEGLIDDESFVNVQNRLQMQLSKLKNGVIRLIHTSIVNQVLPMNMAERFIDNRLLSGFGLMVKCEFK